MIKKLLGGLGLICLLIGILFYVKKNPSNQSFPSFVFPDLARVHSVSFRGKRLASTAFSKLNDRLYQFKVVNALGPDRIDQDLLNIYFPDDQNILAFETSEGKKEFIFGKMNGGTFRIPLKISQSGKLLQIVFLEDQLVKEGLFTSEQQAQIVKYGEFLKSLEEMTSDSTH